MSISFEIKFPFLHIFEIFINRLLTNIFACNRIKSVRQGRQRLNLSPCLFIFLGGLIMKQVTDYFGSLVFDDKVMKSKLSSDVYKKLKKTIQDGEELDISVANSVAQAMKDWAI